MLGLFAYLLLIGSTTVIAQCDSVSEPCILSNNNPIPYMYMRYPNRAYTLETSGTEYCDLFALNSFTWYRSEYDITTYCVPQESCGTRDPIWVNGTIPTEADGVVDRAACLRTYTDCCEREYPIKMKNCGYYSVYCFEELPSGCPQRFCFDVDESQITTTTTTTSASTTQNSEPSNCAAEDDNKLVVIVLSVVVSLLVTVIVIQLVVIYHQRSKITSTVLPNINPQKGEARPFSGRNGQIPKTPPPPYMKPEDYLPGSTHRGYI